LETRRVIAYKFLAPGAVGPFTGLAWPSPRDAAPGEWVTADGELAPCRSGVHAANVATLSAWIDEELWQVELGGEAVEFETVIVAQRGRLLEPVAAWDSEMRRAFARACAARVGEHASRSPDDELMAARAASAEATAVAPGSVKDVALVAFMARHVASRLDRDGFAAERAWQGKWLAERLGL
jgi:hypothetical protein